MNTVPDLQQDNANSRNRQTKAAAARQCRARTGQAGPDVSGQIEALNRYRNNGGPAVTVQNVSVGDGDKAIVGNVTQHASVIVSDKRPTAAATDSRMVSMPDCSAREHASENAKPEAA